MERAHVAVGSDGSESVAPLGPMDAAASGSRGPPEPSEPGGVVMDWMESERDGPTPRSAPRTVGDGILARRQSPDGSFSGSVAHTLDALVKLAQRGHTRRFGVRRRVVLKACGWLTEQLEPEARQALVGWLEAVERGQRPALPEGLARLLD